MSVRSHVAKLALVSALFSATFTSSALASPSDYFFDVSVRGTGSATIHASIFQNPHRTRGVTILAVHGFTERASMFAPLSAAIFADARLGRTVERVIAIDMIGHGDSSPPTLPSPLEFSDLTIEDNISVVIQAIDKLHAAGFPVRVVMGHSMGGLEIQGAQEALLAQNSSLAQHGIFGAVLIDAVPARGTVWTQPPPADLSQFVVDDPTLGTILDLPAAAGASAGGFTRLDGTLAPDTPSVDTFVQNDWIAPEPITTVLELTGTSAPLERPAVRQNAFAPWHGTVLTVISGSEDVLTPAVDQDDLYTYLTGIPLHTDDNGLSDGTSAHFRLPTLFRPIVASDAVHSMFIANPSGLLDAVERGLRGM